MLPILVSDHGGVRLRRAARPHPPGDLVPLGQAFCTMRRTMAGRACFVRCTCSVLTRCVRRLCWPGPDQAGHLPPPSQPPCLAAIGISSSTQFVFQARDPPNLPRLPTVSLDSPRSHRHLRQHSFSSKLEPRPTCPPCQLACLAFPRSHRHLRQHAVHVWLCLYCSTLD